MSRKTKPSVLKPVFDEESILSFAAMCTDQQRVVPDPERSIITLQLKPESLTLLRAEAARKGKTVDQIVAKLVSKHLGKHCTMTSIRRGDRISCQEITCNDWQRRAS